MREEIEAAQGMPGHGQHERAIPNRQSQQHHDGPALTNLDVTIRPRGWREGRLLLLLLMLPLANCAAPTPGIPIPQGQTVIARERWVDIRRHNPHTVAEITVTATAMAALREGHGRISAYLAGANARGQAIGGAAWVSLSGCELAERPCVEESWRITVPLPAGLRLHDAPAPTDAAITLRPVREQVVAVLPFTGALGPLSIVSNQLALRSALANGPWQPVGEARLWLHDSPFAWPASRRNAIWIDVTPRCLR